MESIFQRGHCVVAEAITNKLSPPEKLPTSLRLCQQFASGLLLKQRDDFQSQLLYRDQSLSTCLGGSDKKTKKHTASIYPV